MGSSPSLWRAFPFVPPPLQPNGVSERTPCSALTEGAAGPPSAVGRVGASSHRHRHGREDARPGLVPSRDGGTALLRSHPHMVHLGGVAPEWGVKSTDYFRAIRSRPDRALISDDWILRVVTAPDNEHVQADGRVRRWGRIPEAGGRYLRVVLLPDGETVHNAFFDRGFKP